MESGGWRCRCAGGKDIKRNTGARVASGFALLVMLVLPLPAPGVTSRFGVAYAAPHAHSRRIATDAPARVDAFFAALTSAHHFSGTVLMARQGKALLDKGYSMADWSHRVRNASGTEFLIPGVENQFAAVAILQLMEQGRLHESDHICAYVVHCPASWSAITLRQILNWTSGIYDYANDPANRNRIGQPIALRDLITFIGRHKLVTQPGKGCCTFTPSFPIEQYIVERVSGQDYGFYLQRHFLGPVGLAHMAYYRGLPHVGHHAIDYINWRQPAVPSAFNTDLSFIGGMMYATAGDLYRWNEALRGGKVLAPAWVARLFAPSYVTCPPDCIPSGPEKMSAGGVGYGWFTATTVLYGSRAYTTGTTGGFDAADAFYFPYDVTLIILGNVLGFETYLSGGLESRIFG